MIAAAVCGITFSHRRYAPFAGDSAHERGAAAAEIRRILKPGGRYLFLEHVAAMIGSPLSRFQRLLARPWQWAFDGCHLNRDTHLVLGRAGFSSLDMDCFMLATPAVMIMPHIFGAAVK